MDMYLKKNVIMFFISNLFFVNYGFCQSEQLNKNFSSIIRASKQIENSKANSFSKKRSPASNLIDTSFKVNKISDGDTFMGGHRNTAATWELKDNKNTTSSKIGLAFIDSPEKRQPFGEQSLNFLKNLIQNKWVQLKCYSITDKSDRLMCSVFLEGVDVNLLMVKNGYAWANLDQKMGSTFVDAENDAKFLKKGLWNDPNPIPPWEWKSGKFKKTLNNQNKNKKKIRMAF